MLIQMNVIVDKNFLIEITFNSDNVKSLKNNLYFSISVCIFPFISVHYLIKCIILVFSDEKYRLNWIQYNLHFCLIVDLLVLGRDKDAKSILRGS